jgi:UrcA family protein
MKSNGKTGCRALAPVLTAMLITCGLAAANAIAGDQVRIETVKFQDLNVDTKAGVAALYGRIHLAARRVCTETGRMQQAQASACAAKAEAQAIEKLNLPLLTSYYRTKTGDRAQMLSANAK